MAFSPRPACCANTAADVDTCIHGGTTGQLLKKLSNVDCDYGWSTVSGGTGGDAPRYTHTQSSADTTWTINHNLTLEMVSVQVQTNDGRHLLCDIEETSDNQVVLTFTSAITGKALIT